ncbi:sulfite exporter TauE/SafE family protein [Clostridium botulinum]|uniref:Probable membrane transporter protein n=1 Tax=Clostridium botulinum B str. Osaka05 TaxID=1407017 RepID=A0A0S6U3G9_CLOBO|nr:sulfite exporter TauE/SafE family protein [Clostridium botulinum]EKO1912333.1 sulfite exporter TauE/SafE family protein [Clostridium botulinum]EKO2042394.1 sulfite exporter TauE/SafE family protein [Clostridium botulinum]MBO0525953.1 sulfite exporter TauE/SafE family protein [Clostridium botulinum]MBO0528546.1 sulfite exporter TauE/SafE family protein [Clostridium botulinum]MBO0530556.1 sulfite exporter TauE/SafE family protein [Clostridium botulinum]
MVKVVLGLLIILTIFFAVAFFRDYFKATKEGNLEKTNFFALGAVGFITNFFDTLGIGSFAPTTALLKNFKLSKDRTLPGTLNVACTIPVAMEAILFINGIEVEPITLFSLLISATVGAVVGAGVVSKLDEKKVQFGMGVALIIVALVMLAGQLKLMPAGGDAVGLQGVKLIVAIIGNFILGALMTLGIGLYAPCMALVYALGMSPKVAFPIMMGSCAFLMPAASLKFVKEGAYDRKASMAITIFGLVGVFIAYYLVKSLPLDILKWLVIVVIIYTAAMMFNSASKAKKAAKA